MESHERFKSTIGFIDILFNILVGIAFLFIVAFVLIKPESKEQDFERKAEFVVTLSWTDDRVEDMDLWVQDPTGNQVSYRAPAMNFMHLDKDDLGKRNDTVTVAGKEVQVNVNREVVTIRGIMPGEYIVNAHMYSNHGMPIMMDGKLQKPMERGPLDVSIEVIKLNPSYTILHESKKMYTEKGQEKTFYRFTIDGDGKVTDFGYNKKNFIKPWTGATPITPQSQAREFEGGDVVEEDR